MFIPDGAPCAVKAACTVRSGGKSGDKIKGLPIAIRCKEPGHEAADGWRRCRFDWHDSDPAAEWSVWLTNRRAALAAYTYYKNHQLRYGNRWTPIRCVRVFGRTSISRHELVPVFPLYTNCLRYGWL